MSALIERFLRFLERRCDGAKREAYIQALERIVPGSYGAEDVGATFSSDELDGLSAKLLVPNVRLANGRTKRETRERLMLAFNTPFFPEVLIASSVMAEGVDLHLSCQHVIHHDLCWNPSTLEQRTGRLDRIGAQVELSGTPLEVYLPYVAETQDEKMFRVVLDRERWFQVVMGERFKTDARTTERQASRVPLALEAAEALAFRLEVARFASGSGDGAGPLRDLVRPIEGQGPLP